MKTSPFDLGLAEAGHPLITRAGKRVASFEMTSHESFPIRVMVPGSGGFGNGSYVARVDGRMHPENDSEYDLLLLIEDNEPVKGFPAIDGRSLPLETQVGGDHYKNLAIQPVIFCERNNLSACESSVVKYVCRHRSKGGRKDLEKAIHYLQILIEEEYPNEWLP
jgi:hypothetical protein